MPVAIFYLTSLAKHKLIADKEQPLWFIASDLFPGI